MARVWAMGPADVLCVYVCGRGRIPPKRLGLGCVVPFCGFSLPSVDGMYLRPDTPWRPSSSSHCADFWRRAESESRCGLLLARRRGPGELSGSGACEWRYSRPPMWLRNSHRRFSIPRTSRTPRGRRFPRTISRIGLRTGPTRAGSGTIIATTSNGKKIARLFPHPPPSKPFFFLALPVDSENKICVVNTLRG